MKFAEVAENVERLVGKMPAGLREAHHQLDLAVDRLCRSRPFTSDEERLEHLFKLYENLSNSESAFEFTQKKRPKGNGK